MSRFLAARPQLGNCLGPLPSKGGGWRVSGRGRAGRSPPPQAARATAPPARPGFLPRLETYWPGLCSPDVCPAARRPVQMRPGCGSGVRSAGDMSRPWALRNGSQSSALPALRPAWPGRPPSLSLRPDPAPPVCRAPPPPASSTLNRLRRPATPPPAPSRAPRAAEPAAQRSQSEADAARPQPALCARASGAAPRCTLGVVVRAAQPRETAETRET